MSKPFDINIYSKSILNCPDLQLLKSKVQITVNMSLTKRKLAFRWKLKWSLMFSEYRTILLEYVMMMISMRTQLFSCARFIVEVRVINTIFLGSQHPCEEGMDRDFSPAYLLFTAVYFLVKLFFFNIICPDICVATSGFGITLLKLWKCHKFQFSVFSSTVE